MAGRKMSFSVSFLSIAASLIFASGNGCPKSTGGNGGGGGPAPTPPVFEVTISPLDPIIKAGVELKLTATAANAIGEVAYTWKVNDQEIGNTNALTYTPSLIDEACDQPLKISVTAKDSNRTATTSVDTIASKTWCTYTTANTGVGGLLSNLTTKLALAQDGKKIWIGTNKGLNSFDGNAWTQITSSNSPLGNTAGFSATNITSVFEANGIVWVAACSTRDGECIGVQGFNGDNPTAVASWKTYSTLSPRDATSTISANFNVLANDNVKQVARLDDKTILVATLGGVAAVDITTNTQLKNLIPTQWVNAIAFDEEGRIWFGMGDGPLQSGEGIWVYSGINDPAPKRIDGSQWGGYTDIRTLASDKRAMYVGIATNLTLGGGFVEGMLGSNSEFPGIWQRYTVSTDNRMPGNDIRKIVIGKEREGNRIIWVATSAGLGRFLGDLSLWESSELKASVVKGDGGLTTDDLNDLAYDANTDTLWIATNGGGLTRLRVGLL